MGFRKKYNCQKMNNESTEFQFSSLRYDWYVANQALPRAILRHCFGKNNYIFVGFPRQWIPIFEWYKIPWKNSISPQKYIPIFSDYCENEIVKITEGAKVNNTLRNFVEATSMFDPITSDFLYIVDHKLSLSKQLLDLDSQEFRNDTKSKKLLLNGWQSYGRPSILSLENKILTLKTDKKVALILPCSMTRPYSNSKTHKKAYSIIEGMNFGLEDMHKIVISSIGIIPEELWEIPQVMSYDSGVPDIYRLLRLGRKYFFQNSYQLVVDCLQFEPYSDILRILKLEGAIANIQKVNLSKNKKFFAY
jgi:hypothetical protein